ncbi:MAG: apolipoprotein N-acyltransferase [Spirochaetia bacterium]|jgi:apolipoprotein N-acyltransferase|nr:apolipoprotein N-acyltransferase [Spirochaetia bacterium]
MTLCIALSLASALLGALALPNELFLHGAWPLGFFALAPLYRALKSCNRPRQAALLGALYGGLHHSLSSYWLYFYRGFAFWTLGSTTIAYAVIYAVAAVYAQFLLSGKNKAYAPFIFALGWTVLEYLKSIGFLGYPWGLIPYSLSALPLLLQIVDITGVYGLSFLLSLSSALVAHWLERPGFNKEKSRPVAFFLILTTLCLAYGLYSMWRVIPVKAEFEALMVQQNTDPWIAGELAALSSNLELTKNALSPDFAEDAAPRPDLIVFSENSLRRPLDDFHQWYSRNPPEEPFLPFLAKTGIPLLTGSPIVLDWERYEATNSVILVSPEGRILDSYAKIHPVPFAEAIPFWEYEWFRNFMQNVVGLESGWVMGDRLTLFELEPQSAPGTLVRFSTPICFEDAFAGLCRRYILEGADLLVNLTNDSWSRTQSAQLQHWAIARLRAIENRRTLVRSTNSGVSSVIDPWGRSIAELPQFEAKTMLVRVPVYVDEELSFYCRFGDWFAIFCLLLLIFAAVCIYREKSRHPFDMDLPHL